MNKKRIMILIFAVISIPAFLVEIAHTEKRVQNANLLAVKMAENLWLESKKLYDAEKDSKRNLLWKESLCINSSYNSKSREMADETIISNHTALEWGEEPLQNVYESYWVFPFEEMELADDKEFAQLREIFSEIQFYGGFPLGDEEKYKICKDKYDKLLKNEIKVTDPETGKECYLEEFELVLDKYGDKPYDLERYHFYLFDMDGNGAPELCLFDLLNSDIMNSMCIFKYDFSLDKIILWEYFGSHYTLLFGANSVGGENGNANEFNFYKIDECPKAIFRTGFVWEGFFTNGNLVCMVILPQYRDDTKKDQRIEKMKEKAFYEKQTGRYYLRITEEQYEELSSHYFKARKKAAEELDKLEMNYSEMFG